MPKLFKLVKNSISMTSAINRDREEGHRLQKLANAMLRRGEKGESYMQIRQAAETHLGFWDWQASVAKWKLVGITDPTKELYPPLCKNAPGGSCKFLPAGNSSCRTNDCPTYV